MRPCIIWLLAACVLLTAPAPAAARWHLTKVQMVSRERGWALASTPRGSALLRTTNGGKDWRNVSPSAILPLSPAQSAANEDYGIGREGIGLYGLSGRTCWVAMISEFKQIVVERTRDGGRHWAKFQFANRTGYSLLLSVLDRRHGWILTISDMASGSTRKELYRTKDGGRTWAFVTDVVPDHIDPHGMTFRTASEGWLAAGYHGSDEMPFYRTDDGGKTWHVQLLPEPAVYQNNGYGNLNPPQFFGSQKRFGTLVVDYRNNVINRFERITYVTRSGGRTWRISQRKRIKE